MKINITVPRNYDGLAIDAQGNRITEEATGAAYIASFLEGKGHEILFVPSLENGIDDYIKKVIEFDPKIIGFSVDTPNVRVTKKLIQQIHKLKPETYFILGGNHLLSGGLANFSGITPNLIGVIGEGEITIEEVVDNIRTQNKDLENILGISFFDDNNLVQTPKRPRITNLDALPFPKRLDNLVNNQPNGIFIYPSATEIKGYASVSASRGCYYKCNFCITPEQWGSKVIHRSVDNVIHEIMGLKQRFETNFIFFNDLNFTSNPDWTKEFCKTLIKENIMINWMCMANISTSNDIELFSLMNKAGCSRIMWGIETLDMHGANHERKYQDIKRTYEVLLRAESNHIINHGFYMIGLPEDTKDSILSVIPNLSDLPLHTLRIGITVPYNGTGFGKKAPKITEFDYTKWDGLNLVWEHPNLTESQCHELRQTLLHKFYESDSYKSRINRFLKLNLTYGGSYNQFVKSNIEIKRLTQNMN